MKKAFWDNFFLSFKEIWKFDKLLTLVLFLEIIINSAAPFPNILLSGLIVDSLILSNNFKVTIIYILVLFGSNLLITIIKTSLQKIREYKFVKFTNKLSNDINIKCMNIDYELFNDSSFQDRIMLINQMSQGKNFFTNISNVFEIFSRFITLLGVMWIMTSLNIWLILISFIVIVLQSIFHIMHLRYDREYKSDIIHEQRKIGYVSRLAKDVETKKEISMFDMNNFILNKIISFQKTMLGFEKNRIKTNTILETLTYISSILFQISAYVLVGIQTFKGNISIGDFSVGVSSLITFMSATTFLTTNILTYNDSIYYIRRYKSFQDLRTKYDNHKAISLKDIDLNNLEIEFKNVSFRYPNSTNFVLKNINLKIKFGEKLAIVGFNGAGKTTFTLLLTRMYDPTEGEILLNGINIRNINYRDYQKIFSTVNQDFSLLAFSMLENITIKDNVSENERLKVLDLFKENGMEKRINKMYRGLDTPVTKVLDASGIDLSGGEKQKIAIVRALYKSSPVIIMDEPTAALDPISEYETYQEFSNMSKGKTTILISHRIYSTRFCDKIAVFNKGEIVEYGSFNDLINIDGLYKDFFQKQAEYFK